MEILPRGARPTYHQATKVRPEDGDDSNQNNSHCGRTPRRTYTFELEETSNAEKTSGGKTKGHNSHGERHIPTQKAIGNESTYGPPPPPSAYRSIHDDEEDDPIGSHHKRLLKLFDAVATSLRTADDVSEFISKHPELQASLDKPDDEGRTLLHTIAKPEKPAAFDRRKELFKWLMNKYKELYRVEDGSERTVLGSAVRQRNRKRPHFVRFFVTEFPAETSELLRKDKTLIHDLLPMAKESTKALLDYLDEDIMMHPDAGGNTVLHLASEYSYVYDEDAGAQPVQLELIKALIHKCPEALKATNKWGHSAYQHRVFTFCECRKPGLSDKERPLHDDPIAIRLKDEYMHLEHRDDTIRLLHGAVQECEIHFDLLELANTNLAVTAQDLRDLVKSLKFERILQYVRIPCLRSKIANDRSYQEIRSSDTDGIGRKDFQLIFDLLWGRGVRKIIKVIVDDDEETPHSDEIIETLSRFDIEEWDWRKVDLCSETIFKAAPHLQKVFLYSSGNNAVLRSWSGVDGLSHLTQLNGVHIFIRQRLESEARTRNNLAEFTKRLKANCPKALLHPHIQKDAGGKGLAGQAWFEGADKVEANAWLENIDKFASFITNIPSYVKIDREVKVAIIDDGIDKLHGGFYDSIKEGVSFYTPPGSYDTRPYYFSSSGHGTLMAKIVRRVCPKAQLYIARLEQGDIFDVSQRPTAESAAKAIDWAIKKDVDIISMSWTIPLSEISKDDLQKLESAVHLADERKILMFGSASDQGYNTTSSSMPGSMPEVFCIGAAKLSGHAEDTAARESQFVFPGSSVRMAKSPSTIPGLATNDSELASGSSFATALAAGLTALILYCVEIVGLGEHRDGIRDARIMAKIFEGMTFRDMPKYVVVEDCFSPDFAKLEWEEEGEKHLVAAVEKIIRPWTDKVQSARRHLSLGL